MNLRGLIVAPLIFALTACVGGDRFPYPPQFVSPQQVPAETISPPPPQYSAQYAQEIDAILARQESLSAVEKSAIMQEDHIAPQMMVTPVLGKRYSEKAYPQLFTLLKHAASDAWRIGDAAQDHWGRTRPWVADERVQLLVSSIKRPSYPSGHSTTNHIWAHVLSELFPEKRSTLFGRAYEIGMHRSAAGVHYPSDVAAGKTLAAKIYGVMREDAQFQRELAAAKAELKVGQQKLKYGKIAGCAGSGGHPAMNCR